MKLFYLIGEPGAGKSTLIAKMTEECLSGVQAKPFATTMWTSRKGAAIELGARRPGGFGGTDSLSMSVQPKVLEWLQRGQLYPVFGEGDRLANGKFFTGVSALEIDLTVAYLEVPPELAEERRVKRAAELGTKSQDEKWVAGRRTKVLRLAEDWATVILKGESRDETLVAALRSQPVFKHLHEGSSE